MANQILGIGELQASFTKVSDDMKTRTARYMVASAGGVVRKEAKAIALSLGLRKTSALINNIAIKRERTPDGVAQYHLGVRHGRNQTKKGASKLLLKIGKSGRVVYANDPYYWRFLEFTTKRRTGTPFLSKALENKQQEALGAMEAGLQKHLDKAGK